MASFLSRRLAASTKLLLQNPNPKSLSSFFHADVQLRSLSEHRPAFNLTRNFPLNKRIQNPDRCPIFFRSRSISTNNLIPQSIYQLTKPYSSESKPPNPNPNPPQDSELRHQEIVGPTVERDVSSLAEETRKTLESVQRSIRGLSSALAVLGFAHLGLGAWISYAVGPPYVVSVQGFAAFGFPFTLALLIRRSLGPMSFFHKMEEQGRLQILTLALQVSKTINVLFLRVRVVSLCCVAGISVGSVLAICLR